MSDVNPLTPTSLEDTVRVSRSGLLRLRDQLAEQDARGLRLAAQVERLHEAHRHCWHDNAPYLCEGETCGDVLEEVTPIQTDP